MNVFSRKILPLLALSAAVLSLNACLVVSVRPFYFADDVVEVPRLVGSWSGDGETWTFEKSENGYLWRGVEEDGDELVAEATFFKLRGHLFMDFRLSEQDYEATGDAVSYTIRAHSVARVRHGEDDALWVDHLSLEFLEETLKKGLLDLDHHESDDRIVLTGSTTELQGYLAWCLERPGCFYEDSEGSAPMTRIR